ncbi:MAG TPA: glycosyltransferase family 9 protein [Candidatus Aquilonibacter sp.]|nr:glycosyltransferase family 9 protein [Candidatus Aquilonibacter sp.]
MADPRFLLVRLGSMGDVIHALPAASALRDTFPGARIDWAVDPKWARLLEGNPDVTEVIPADRKSASGVAATILKMRAAKYTCAIDFQALYKSALLAFASGAPRRVGFQSSYAREGLASLLYTDRLNPRGGHKVDHNLTLAESAGAKKLPARFPIAIRPEDEERVERELSAHALEDFYVLNPGGGWLSKCWPARRYGELHRVLAERYGWRGVVTFGPGEEGLARQVVRAAGDPAPAAILLGLGPLMALMRRAKFVVSADTGPLHLAAALDTPVAGLFGSTDPVRNGPYSADASRHVVLRNPQNCETTYRRGKTWSPAMLSIGVPQVVEAIARRWGKDS